MRLPEACLIQRLVSAPLTEHTTSLSVVLHSGHCKALTFYHHPAHNQRCNYSGRKNGTANTGSISGRQACLAPEPWQTAGKKATYIRFSATLCRPAPPRACFKRGCRPMPLHSLTRTAPTAQRKPSTSLDAMDTDICSMSKQVRYDLHPGTQRSTNKYECSRSGAHAAHESPRKPLRPSGTGAARAQHTDLTALTASAP